MSVPITEEDLFGDTMDSSFVSAEQGFASLQQDEETREAEQASAFGGASVEQTITPSLMHRQDVASRQGVDGDEEEDDRPIDNTTSDTGSDKKLERMKKKLREMKHEVEKQRLELLKKDEVIKAKELALNDSMIETENLRKSVEMTGEKSICDDTQQLRPLLRDFLEDVSCIVDTNENLAPILALLPSSWRFCCEAKPGDTGKEVGDVLACMDNLMWTRNEADITRILSSVLIKELREALEDVCDKAGWEERRKRVQSLGAGVKGVKNIREQLRHQFVLQDRAQTFDSDPCICNFDDGVVEMQVDGSIEFRDRKCTDYVTLTTGINGRDWLKPPEDLTEQQRVWYDKLMDSVEKSGFDEGFRTFMLRSLGYILFRYADAAFSKVFWLMISRSNCGKSTWFRLLILAAGAYRGIAMRHQMGKGASELCVASLIASGARFMVLDDAVAKDGIDLVTVTSMFTNIGAVPVRIPRTNQVRLVDMTPVLLVAMNNKYLPVDAGAAEIDKMMLMPEDDCEGRRFMGRFVTNEEEVDDENGVHLINNEFKRILRDKDPENDRMRGAAACILYNAIKETPQFEPRTDYPKPIKRTRDENWAKLCERRERDLKGLPIDLDASTDDAPPLGPPQRILVASSDDFDSVESAFDSTVKSVVDQLVPKQGGIVTLKAFADRMEECVNSIVWQAITKGEPTSRTFKKRLQEQIEMKGLKFQQLQGSAAIKRGPGASGAHLYNYTLPPLGHSTPPRAPEPGPSSAASSSRKRARPVSSDEDE